MELKVFKSAWGMTEPWEAMIEKVAAAGYDGLEFALHGVWPEGTEPAQVARRIRQHGLLANVLVGVQQAGELEQTFEQAQVFEPVRVICHAGRDSMSREEGEAFFEQALQVVRRLDLSVGFETHRGRLLYNPWDLLHYASRFPQLRLTADFSHWVCVCERLPEDQTQALALACERTVHIHGRVGHEQGPQVADPAAPENLGYVQWHERQWDRILHAHQSAGAELITFCPEYGPPSYLPRLPYTQAPVAGLWEICQWSTARLRQRWARLLEKTPLSV